MTKRVPVSVPRLAFGTAVFLAAWTGMGSGVRAQEPAPPPPPPEEAPAAAPAAPPSAPALAETSPPAFGSPTTDHDSIVGSWGVEARRIATFNRTLGQEIGCEQSCPVDLNELGVRRWTSHKYAWSAGLALAFGGGSGRTDAGKNQTWDTYFGVGPTVGASFLLANWKHLAVSLSPQLDFVAFIPSGKGSKSFLVDVRGVVEGEVHLGMIGLPAASVGVASGLTASYLYATKDKKVPSVERATASKWSVGVTGPTALWDLVTKAFLRYYF